MKINRSLVSLIFFLTTALVSSCNDAGFSGSSGEKKAQSADVEMSGGKGSGDGLKNGNPTGELIDNGDGTVSDQFFGLASFQTSVVVDVVIAMDTSGSMSDEKVMLEKNIEQFLRKLNETPGVDSQVFVIGQASTRQTVEKKKNGRTYTTITTTSHGFNFPKLDPARFSVIDEVVKSTDALFKIRDFFDQKFNSSLKLRNEAVKELLVITDDDSSMSAGDFVGYLQSKAADIGRFRVNALAWVPGQLDNGQAWCTKANDGNVYVELSKHPDFGGMVQHLCESDWSKLLNNFADKVIKGNAKSEFTLTKEADPNGKLIVTINNDEKQRDIHWTFDNAKNSVFFVPGHSPQAGDNLIVTYVPLN